MPRAQRTPALACDTASLAFGSHYVLTQTAFCRDVIIGTSPSENASWVSEDTEDSSTGPTGYSAGLRPLNRRTTAKLLVESAAAGDAALPSEALTEQFDRAQQYVERNVEEFSQEQQDSLEVSLPHLLLHEAAAPTCSAAGSAWCGTTHCSV